MTGTHREADCDLPSPAPPHTLRLLQHAVGRFRHVQAGAEYPGHARFAKRREVLFADDAAGGDDVLAAGRRQEVERLYDSEYD